MSNHSFYDYLSSSSSSQTVTGMLIISGVTATLSRCTLPRYFKGCMSFWSMRNSLPLLWSSTPLTTTKNTDITLLFQVHVMLLTVLYRCLAPPALLHNETVLPNSCDNIYLPNKCVCDLKTKLHFPAKRKCILSAPTDANEWKRFKLRPACLKAKLVVVSV